jgi:Asp-tRNA(Asn)/Glu-tRNA(Gln) amidotransferase A subunit family amidase
MGGDSIQTVAVAVPSRIKFFESVSKPLSGWRVAVKDIFQIEGIKTSVCNRAYYDLYPKASQTAQCIKILEEQGACVVGTTKLAAFAATEEPVECVDYQAPFNPRADGYQSPAGSSSGSGVVIASYQWIDIAIGSDSTCEQVTYYEVVTYPVC